MKLLLAQKPFISLQGEGKFIGTPSIFIRTFGCNLRCNFGLQKNEVDNFWKTVIKENKDKKNLEDLTVYPFGCDSYYAILPEFKHFSIEYNFKKLFNEIYERFGLENNDIVITGGEPLFLRNQKFWIKFIEKLKLNGFKERITFETNGTIPLEEETEVFLKGVSNIYFSISPKCFGSGLEFSKTFKKPVIDQYFSVSEKSWLKFVVNNESEIIEIINFMKNFPEYDWFVMPSAGNKERYDKKEIEIFDLCVKYKIKMTPRLQMIKYNGVED